jgi:hypothetical protein
MTEGLFFTDDVPLARAEIASARGSIPHALTLSAVVADVPGGVALHGDLNSGRCLVGIRNSRLGVYSGYRYPEYTSGCHTHEDTARRVVAIGEVRTGS